MMLCGWMCADVVSAAFSRLTQRLSSRGLRGRSNAHRSANVARHGASRTLASSAKAGSRLRQGRRARRSWCSRHSHGRATSGARLRRPARDERIEWASRVEQSLVAELGFVEAMSRRATASASRTLCGVIGAAARPWTGGGLALSVARSPGGTPCAATCSRLRFRLRSSLRSRPPSHAAPARTVAAKVTREAAARRQGGPARPARSSRPCPSPAPTACRRATSI